MGTRDGAQTHQASKRTATALAHCGKVADGGGGGGGGGGVNGLSADTPPRTQQMKDIGEVYHHYSKTA